MGSSSRFTLVMPDGSRIMAVEVRGTVEYAQGCVDTACALLGYHRAEEYDQDRDMLLPRKRWVQPH